MDEIIFRPANEDDWEKVARLLAGAGLPLEGARENLAGFLVALEGDELAGCAGLERYGATGLLRSVAVGGARRGTGLGKELVKQVLSRAGGEGVQNVVLLTETARGFFPKFGFREISRAEVPAPALASVEFQSACPQSAAVMILAIPRLG